MSFLVKSGKSSFDAWNYRFSGQQSPRLRLSLITTFVFLLACASSAHADPEWYTPASSPGVHISPPTTASRGSGLLTWSIDGGIALERGTGGPFGPVALPYFPGGSLNNRPVIARVPDGSGEAPNTYIFATTVAGFLIKLDVEASLATPDEPLKVAKTPSNVPQTRDLRRGVCTFDTLIAEPIVQRRADSNEQFTLDKDIVIIATAHGCDDTTTNQVIALDAADITAPPVWILNSGEYEIGAIHGCVLNLDLNLVHCVAEGASGSFQNSVWTLDTNTGSPIWAAIPDARVQALPALGAPGEAVEGHLYVADMLNRLHVFDAATGNLVDTAVVTASGAGIFQDLAVGDGIYHGMIFVVDAVGILHAFFDSGESVKEAWTSDPAIRIVSAPVPVSALGKIYVGTNAGYFRQLDLATGTTEAGGYLASSDSASPSMIPDERTPVTVYLATDGIYRLVGTYYDPDELFGPKTSQYKLPCQYNSSELCAFAGAAPVDNGPRVLLVDDDDDGPNLSTSYTNALDDLGVGYDVWDIKAAEEEPPPHPEEPPYPMLATYSRIIWWSGDATTTAGPDQLSEGGLSAWLNTGQCLLISSQGYLDVISESGYVEFALNYLGLGEWQLDGTGTQVSGVGTAFGGLGPYSLAYPFDDRGDSVTPSAGAAVAFSDEKGHAGVQHDDGTYRTVMLGFPIEALPDQAARTSVLSRFLDYCAIPRVPPPEIFFLDGFESIED